MGAKGDPGRSLAQRFQRGGRHETLRHHLGFGGGSAGPRVHRRVLLIKPDKIKNEALERIRKASGYEVEAGDASLKVSLTGAGIRVADISFASPDTVRSGRVEDVDVLVKILPLFQRRVELNRLVLHQPVYEQRQPRTGTSPKEDGNPALAFFAVESWEIQDGTYKQEGDWGTVEARGLDLEGGLLLDPKKGGEGNARGTGQSLLLQTPKGSWDIPGLRANLGFTVSPEVDRVDLTEMELASGDLEAVFTGSYEDAGTGWEGRLAGRVDPVAWERGDAFPARSRGRPPGAVGPFRKGGSPRAGDPDRSRPRPHLGSGRGHGVLCPAPGRTPGDQRNPGRVSASRRMRFFWRMPGAGWGRTPSRCRIVAPGHGVAAMDIDTRLAAANLGGLLPESAPLRLQSGSLSLDLAIKGAAPFTDIPEITGRVAGENLEGSLRDLPLKNAGGTIRFTGRVAEIQNLAFQLWRLGYRPGRFGSRSSRSAHDVRPPLHRSRSQPALPRGRSREEGVGRGTRDGGASGKGVDPGRDPQVPEVPGGEYPRPGLHRS